MPADPWSSSLPLPTFAPTADDMEFQHDGLLVSSLYGEDTDGEAIVVGPDLTEERALAAALAWAENVLSWPGYDAAADLQARIRARDLAIAIVPTVFIREPDGSWDPRWHADGQAAAWLVSPWHPAHCFTTA